MSTSSPSFLHSLFAGLWLVATLCVVPAVSAQEQAPASGSSPALAPAAPRPRVALVLSGGAALGIAHVGVIREIERAGIPIDMVLGTSMGSLVGGLYAAGYSPDQMAGIVSSLDWQAFFSERIDPPNDRYERARGGRFPVDVRFDQYGFRFGRGLIEGRNILSMITSQTLHILPVRDFDALPVPYRAVATDIITGEKVVFSSGSVAEAMRASMSIPGLFSPYDVGGRSLVDGGTSDNMPVDIARSMGADVVIAVECRGRPAEDSGELKSALATLKQMVNLYIEENMRPSRTEADLFLRPDLSGFNRSSFTEGTALIARGEEQARTAFAEISALAERIAASRSLVTPDAQPNRRAMRDPPAPVRVQIEAPSTIDEQVAKTAFAGLAGKPLVRSELSSAIAETYANGDYTLVRFDLMPDPENPTDLVGLVRLEPDVPSLGSIFAGWEFAGILSMIPSTGSTLESAFLLHGLPGLHSGMFVQVSLGRRTRVYAEYYQPIGPVYLLPFACYLHQVDTYAVGGLIGLEAPYDSLGLGIRLGFGMNRTVNAEAGWSLEVVQATDPVTGTAVDRSVGTASAMVLARDLSTSVFPERGYAARLLLELGSPAIGGTSSFATAELRGCLAIPLSRNFTLGASVLAATDFSGFAPVAGSLSRERFFNLRSSGMFYGLGEHPEYESGNHAFGMGLELRAKLGRINPLLGGDIFALANLSAGVVQATGSPDVQFMPVRWDASLGCGVRLTKDFGILATAGAVVDQHPSTPVRPVLALVAGPLVTFPETRH